MAVENSNATGSLDKQNNGLSNRKSLKKDANTSVSIIVDETYDESLDPDYNLSNTVVHSSDENYDSEISDIETETETEVEIETEVENGEKIVSLNAESINDKYNGISSSSSSSSLVLPIHKRFNSFVHKNEVPRKLFHVSIGFITLYLHCTGYRTVNVWRPVSIAMSCIFALDLLRFNWSAFNKAYCSVVGLLMREKEVNSFNGVIWFQLGSCITFYFQKQDISIMSILLLSWSDTAASTIGRKFGYLSPKITKGKSLIGSVAAFITGIVACYLFYGWVTPSFPSVSYGFEYTPETSNLNIHCLALLSGFIAALSEGIDVSGLDDNFTIPVLSGFFLSGVVRLAKRA